MSKKKGVSTMTLRDFHGGSIPSDLPLPSAPGMFAERSDRPGFGGRLTRSYTSDRVGFLRQSTANMTRSLEDKALYFPNPANIGRNYDEDERKPVEGPDNHISGIDDQLRSSLGSRSSLSSSKSGGRVDSYTHEEFGLIPVGHSAKALQCPGEYNQGLNPSTCASQEQHFYQSHSFQKSVEPGSPWRQTNMLSPQPTDSGVSAISGVQNVWTAQSEGDQNRTFSNDVSANEVGGGGVGRTQIIASRIAQASALDKVSSGRWNSRAFRFPVEHPQESVDEYSHFPRRVWGNIVAGESSMYTRHPADLGPQVYADSGSGSCNAYTGASYTESITGFVQPSSQEHRRLSSMQRSFSDNRCGDVPSRVFAEGWGDGSSTYQEVSKNSSEDFQVKRNFDDNSGYGLTEIGQRGPSGNNNFYRHDGMGGLAYSNLRRPRSIGESTAVPYNSQQLNSSYGDDRVLDGPKSFTSEHGRQEFSALAQGGRVEYPYGQYSHNDPLGFHCDEGAKGSQVILSPDLYSVEEVTWNSYSYRSSSNLNAPDSLKSPYISDSVKDTRVNERSKFSRAGDSEGGRLQNLRVIHNNSSVNEVAAFPSSVSLEIEPKNDSFERLQLKFHPRTKPLDVDHEDWEAELGQSTSTELQPGMSSASAVSSASATSKPDEDGKPIERRKLNLKPRSQTADIVTNSGSVKERMSVFGGARPRELVLKERGEDDSLISGVKTTFSLAPVSGGQCPSSGGNYHNEEPRHDNLRVQRSENHSRDKREDRWTLDTHNAKEKREIGRTDVGKQDSWRRSADLQSPSYGSPTPMSGEQLSSNIPGRSAIVSAADLACSFSRSTSLGSGVVRGHLGSTTPHTPGSEEAKFSRLIEPISSTPRDVYVSGIQGGGKRMDAF